MILRERRQALYLKAVPNTAAEERSSAPQDGRGGTFDAVVLGAAPCMDDAEILAAVRRGDPSGAEALYDRIRPSACRTIAHLIGHADADEEDLVQISVMEVLSSLRRFRGECSLDTWTSRITARVVFKELHRRRTERRIFDRSENLDTESLDGGATAEDRASMRCMLSRIRGHLKALDSLKGWTLLLHDVCGYDLKEISVITDSSVAAAQSRLVRGRAELQARLEREPELASWLRRDGGAQ